MISARNYHYVVITVCRTLEGWSVRTAVVFTYEYTQDRRHLLLWWAIIQNVVLKQRTKRPMVMRF